MKKLTFLAVGLAFCLAGALWPQDDAQRPPLPEPPAPAGAKAPQPAFPDFGFLPPPSQYDGPLFRLSQKYPTVKPADAKLPFLDIPFNENANEKNWLKYLLAVRQFCFEGNIQDDLEWEIDDDPPKWFHAPWQHWGRNGREGINGLTREATAQPGQLAATQTDPFQTYAVGYYNAPGAYTIGQVWKDHFNPDPTKAKFPVGTVVFKLLFTLATVKQVPFLDPPVEWLAYAETSKKDPSGADPRGAEGPADPNGHHGPRQPRDQAQRRRLGLWHLLLQRRLKSKNPYENLVPVGLQWGNDKDDKVDMVNPPPWKPRSMTSSKKRSSTIPKTCRPSTSAGTAGSMAPPTTTPPRVCRAIPRRSTRCKPPRIPIS